MGLGFRLRVDGGRNLLGRRPAPERLAMRLTQALGEELVAQDPLLGRVLRVSGDANVQGLRLHPAEEELELDVRSGALVVSARTNGAGPGYHAFVLDALSRAAAACGASLHADGGDFQDEGGYLGTGDFAALQAEHLRWLLGVAGWLRDNPDAGAVRLSLPLDAPSLEEGEGVLTSLGPRPAAWFAELLDADAAGRAERAARFFPWWGRGLGAAAWEGMGRALAWMEVPLRRPDSEAEREGCVLALACLERARTLEPVRALPEREMDELRALLAAPEDQADAVPAAEGLGYRRHLLRVDLPDGWSLPLPGYWHEDVEDGGRTLVRWFGGRTVRLTFLSRRGTRAAWEPPAPRRADRVAWLEREEGALHGRAEVAPEEEDGARHLALTGQVLSGSGLCLLSVAFDSPGDLAWAEALFRGLRRAPDADAERT